LNPKFVSSDTEIVLDYLNVLQNLEQPDVVEQYWNNEFDDPFFDGMFDNDEVI
jgi:hypothetical protein